MFREDEEKEYSRKGSRLVTQGSGCRILLFEGK